MDINDSAREIYQAIDAAFDGIAWPAAQNLVSHPSQDGITFEDLEKTYVIARFGGKRREQVEVELDSSFIEELIYLSNHAKLYYLPCFLKKWLTMRDDFSFNIGMIQLLNNEEIKPDADIWPEFTTAQREAICETLAFVLQHKKSYDLESDVTEKLQQAIKSWK